VPGGFNGMNWRALAAAGRGGRGGGPRGGAGRTTGVAPANEPRSPIRSDINFDTSGVNSIEDLIKLVQPQAEQMITGGAEAAEDQLNLGYQRAIEPLLGTAERGGEALTEEANIMGLNGPEAQEQALARINMTPLEKEQIRKETQSLRAQQSAVGGVGGGNAISQMLNLSGEQESRTVGRKLTDLGGVSAKGMGALGDILRLTEEFGAEQAGIPLETSTSLSNILTGTAAPIAESRMAETERRGASNLAVSQGQQQRLSQLSGILGNASTLPFFQPQAATPGPNQWGAQTYNPNAGAQISYGGSGPVAVA
jgi:hypothetical protein